MMNRLFAIAAIAAAPMTAAPITAAVAQTPMTASTYVMKAGAGDQYEIQSSKLVLQSTHNQKIKDFATMMVGDHTKSTADVKAAAMAAGMKPAAPKLDATGMRNVAALRVAKGAMRDRLYLTQQKTAHRNALMLHKNYAANGSVAPLKAAAGEIVPVIEKHIQTLDTM